MTGSPDTERPPLLLCLLVLSNTDEWLSVGDIQEHIETQTDARPAHSTVADALVELRISGRVEYRQQLRNGSETLLYRVRETDTAGS